MIGGTITTSGLSPGTDARATMLRSSSSDAGTSSHFASKLSGVFPGGIEDLQLGTPFSLKPASATTSLNQRASDTPEKAKEAAREMESYFIYMMMKEMWGTLPENQFLDSGLATDIFQEMWLEKVADNLSKGSGIGLAAVLEKQIEATNAAAPPASTATPIQLVSDLEPKAIALQPQKTMVMPLRVPPITAAAGPRATSYGTPMVRPKIEALNLSPMHAQSQIPEVRPPSRSVSTSLTTPPLDIFIDRQVNTQVLPQKQSLFIKPMPLPGTPVVAAEIMQDKPVIQSKPQPKPAPKPAPQRPRSSGG